MPKHGELDAAFDKNDQGIQIHRVNGGTAQVINQQPSVNYQQGTLAVEPMMTICRRLTSAQHFYNQWHFLRWACAMTFRPRKAPAGWFVNHEQYQTWLSEGGIVFLEGGPATGKITLMRYAVFHDESSSNESKTVLANFFQRNVGENSSILLGLYRSLLRQISTGDDAILEDLIRQTEFEKRNRQ